MAPRVVLISRFFGRQQDTSRSCRTMDPKGQVRRTHGVPVYLPAGGGMGGI